MRFNASVNWVFLPFRIDSNERPVGSLPIYGILVVSVWVFQIGITLHKFLPIYCAHIKSLA